MGYSRGPQCHGQGGTRGEAGKIRAKEEAKGARKKGVERGCVARPVLQHRALWIWRGQGRAERRADGPAGKEAG